MTFFSFLIHATIIAMTDIQKIIKAAEAGDSESMNDLSTFYREGNGVAIDIKRAFEWSKKAAEYGHVNAMHNLSVHYHKGIGVEKNSKEAFIWARKAAGENHSGAMYNLSNHYYSGDGVSQDKKEAFAWLLESAENGELKAIKKVSYYYHKGIGVKQNEEKAFFWGGEAADAGDVDSMYYLSNRYLEGVGVTQSNEKAFSWAYEAAKYGQVDAIYNVSIFYYKGKGVSQNSLKAFEWSLRAAEKGHVNAMHSVAIHYLQGSGVKLNLKKAFEWSKKAAQSGHTGAMSNLSKFYREGEVVKCDINLAIYWIKKSAKLGDTTEFIKLNLILLIQKNVSDQDSFDSNLYNRIEVKLFNLLSAVKRIKEKHIIKDKDAKSGVAHFTTKDVIKKMLPDSGDSNNHVRLYNIEYVNDLNEGKRLFELFDHECKKILNNFLQENEKIKTSEGEKERSVYVGSFTLSVDRLDLWRAYGNDGDGYCVVSPLEAFKSSSEDTYHPLYESIQEQRSFSSINTFSRSAVDSGVPTYLYKVLYEDDDVKDTLDMLLPSLKDINIFRDTLKTGKDIVDMLVSSILLDIIYLYKHPEYKTENEARIISTFDISDTRLKLDDDQYVPKIYAKTTPFLFKFSNSKIIIGPKVQSKKTAELYFKHRLSNYNFYENCEVLKSTISYR